MGNMRLDPNDPNYYGYVDATGFHRLGRMPDQKTWYEKYGTQAAPSEPHFSSYRQRVQYENIKRTEWEYSDWVGNTGDNFNPGNPANVDPSAESWEVYTEEEFNTQQSTAYSPGSAGHYNARCNVNPAYEYTFKVSKKMRGGYWVPVMATLAMPDGQPFPDSKFDGYMWAWPESKEPDGMDDCLKRYKHQRRRPDVTIIDNPRPAYNRALVNDLLGRIRFNYNNGYSAGTSPFVNPTLT